MKAKLCKMSQRYTPSLLIIIILLVFAVGESLLFEPFNVTYDHRSLIIGGRRRLLISAGIHYPRATPQMWPDLIAKAKEGGVDVIETYTFWNGHEPVKGEYNFEGRYDLVKFAKLVGSSGLYLFLRIGPYVCAEWNFGGFPVWLRDIPGIEFRTDNEPFKKEMQQFVTKIVDLMRDEMLFSWQGGPIILLQIENEYGNIQSSYGHGGHDYIYWAAKMAVGLDAGVPWVMCRQNDAPDLIINTCNGYYCDGFKPQSNKKPAIWTEDWDGWYSSWGGRLPHRPVEDLAFAVARFFQRGGSLQNYYMYFGGTNFGRTAGGPFYITSYDYDAPIDEYGLLRQPKWGHLKDLHSAIKLCEPALVAVDSPHYVKLGPMQEAHVYRKEGKAGRSRINESGVDSLCSAFLANIDQHNVATVHFEGRTYKLPPWSVSILPDCQSVVYNTAKVGAQTSIKELDFHAPHPSNTSVLVQNLHQDDAPLIAKHWMTVDEPVEIWSPNNFSVQGILEHLNVTKDSSDYLWYFTRIHISGEDVSFWEENEVHPALKIDSMRDVVHIFINGQLSGSKVGRWVQVAQPIELLEGYNDVALLSLTVGLQNYGAFLEKDGGGFRGQIKLTGLKNGDMDLSNIYWTYQVGLKGEMQEIYTLDGEKKAAWIDLPTDNTKTPLSWYKTYFDAPDGLDPVALDLRSMGKGQAWVNGHHIGRYWTLSSPQDGCQTCDYRGTYDSNKCTTNCGKPTQVRYHVPRSWLQDSDNLLVLFEETGGNPFEISLTSHYTQIICSSISDSHNPPLSRWLNYNGQLLVNDTTPEMHLHCEDNHVISIGFASYGTPEGSCQMYSRGSCHAPKSFEVVSRLCQGRQYCSIEVSNANLGGDPCRGVVKTLVVEAKCIPAQVTGLSSI